MLKIIWQTYTRNSFPPDCIEGEPQPGNCDQEPITVAALSERWMEGVQAENPVFPKCENHHLHWNPAFQGPSDKLTWTD